MDGCETRVPQIDIWPHGTPPNAYNNLEPSIPSSFDCLDLTRSDLDSTSTQIAQLQWTEKFAQQSLHQQSALQDVLERENNVQSAQVGHIGYQETFHISAPQRDHENGVVCYGMLNDVAVSSIYRDVGVVDSLPVQWDGSIHLQDPWDGNNIVKLSQRTFEVLTMVAQHANASFQLWLRRPQLSGARSMNLQKSTTTSSFQQQTLAVIIYGKLDMAGLVGEWLDKVGLFLQMPFECFFDVPYKNPHCLSFDDKPAIMTKDLQKMQAESSENGETTTQQSFAGLYTDETYDEAEQPCEIVTPLHKHQKAALNFLLEREKGWDLKGVRAGIWKQHTDAFGATKYKNFISGRIQNRPPDEFRGGILADEMGLGKTCTMLSLIATDKFERNSLISTTSTYDDVCLGTLVIVPFSLLQVWEKQINQHFRPNTIRWTIFHGVSRQLNAVRLSSFDIVITTYNTVALEWKIHSSSRESNNTSQLFANSWHRIVLDEAHVIRNKGTANSKAVHALRSERRWCITGTPIQNRLRDLFGILWFLGVEPYNHFKHFETDILRPWRSHNDKVALMRLLHLLKAITIRRPRTIISLPSKQELFDTVQFSSNERAIYEDARQNAISFLDAVASEQQKGAFAYINALQRINDLRYICNHGARPARQRHSVDCASRKLKPNSSMEDFDKLMDDNDNGSCIQCGTDLQEEIEEDQQQLIPPAHPSRSFSITTSSRICRSCLRQNSGSTSPYSPSLASSDGEDTHSPPSSLSYQSSKITALLRQIQCIPTNEKCVIFSYWTSTLAAVAHHLTQSSIPFIQYDGSMSRAKRNQILHDFTTDPSIHAILVSITCGGQGLDLTVANHAFLLEPQWNPMLEEQAMSRVYRLGQTKPVRLVRFIVQGTWEEKIRILQDRKRSLIDLIVDKRNLMEGDDGKKQLYYLRELIT